MQSPLFAKVRVTVFLIVLLLLQLLLICVLPLSGRGRLLLEGRIAASSGHLVEVNDWFVVITNGGGDRLLRIQVCDEVLMGVGYVPS